jgi:hypothetical protein
MVVNIQMIGPRRNLTLCMEREVIVGRVENSFIAGLGIVGTNGCWDFADKARP